MGTDRTSRNNRERRAIRQRIGNVREDNEKSALPESLAWDAMIRDAKKRIEELKQAIDLFEKKKAAGERWPGAPSENQGAGQQDSVEDTTQFPAS
jgi:hypothetical protein